MGDLLDKAVKPQPFKDSRDSRPTFVREELTQREIPEASDGKLVAGKDGEKLVVIIMKEVEALVGPAVGGDRFGNRIELLDSLSRIGEIGDELKIAAIGCFEQACEGEEAISSGFTE